MYIKIKQTQALGDGETVGFGKIKTPLTKAEGTAKYEFIYKNVVYAEFTYTVTSKIKKIMKTGTGFFNANKFTAEYKGAGNFIIQAETIKCPQGFTENLGIFEKDLGNGRKNVFSSTEQVYYENNQVVGRLRQYALEDVYSLLGKIPTVKLDYYDAINWKGQNYYLYPIKNGGTYYYCIYNNSTLIAMVEMDKNETVRSEYTIYAYDNIDIDFLCLMGAKFDYTYFETYSNSKSKTATPSFENSQQPFQDKFDPNFINKIISVEKKQ